MIMPITMEIKTPYQIDSIKGPISWIKILTSKSNTSKIKKPIISLHMWPLIKTRLIFNKIWTNKRIKLNNKIIIIAKRTNNSNIHSQLITSPNSIITSLSHKITKQTPKFNKIKFKQIFRPLKHKITSKEITWKHWSPQLLSQVSGISRVSKSVLRKP